MTIPAMSGNSDSNTQHMLWGVPIPIVVCMVALTGTIFAWSVRVEQTLTSLRVANTAQEQRLDRIELGVIAPIALVQQELKTVEMALQAEVTRTSANTDSIQRAQERVDRLDTPLAKVVQRLEDRVERLEAATRVPRSSPSSGGN